MALLNRQSAWDRLTVRYVAALSTTLPLWSANALFDAEAFQTLTQVAVNLVQASVSSRQ